MKKLGLILATSICMLLVSATALGATRTSVQSGPWSDPLTWDTGVPIAGDSAVIANTHTVTLTANASVGTGAGATVTVQSGGVLDLVSFTLTANTLTIDNGGEVRQGGSSAAPAGTVTTRSYAAGSTYTFNGTQAGLSGTHPTYGNLNFAPTPAGAGTFATALSIAGSMTINLGAVQEVRFSTGTTGRTPSIAGNLNIQAGIVVGSNGSSAAGSATITVGGNLNITGGTFRGTNDVGNATFNIAGNIINGGTWQQDDGSSTGVFTTTLNGSTVQNISGANAISFEVLTINNPSGITLSRDVDVTSTLGLTSGNISTGVNIVSLGSAGSVSRTSGHVIGNFLKAYAGAGSKVFEVGTANGYSPVTVNATAGTFPANFTVSATQGVHPSVNAGTSISRYWTLTNTTVSSADLIFQYLVGDVNGTEANYKAIRISGGTPVSFPTSTVDTIGHTVSVNGVTGFSDWTAGEPLAPTANNSTIAGRIITADGTPVEGAVVYLSGTQNRKFITDAMGVYQFDKVETSGFYTVTPMRPNFGFSPGSQSFSQLGERTEAAFTGVFLGKSTDPLDTPEYFVRQHYLDFLGREPDEAGFNFWSDQILGCGNDAACIERRTINVSAAYFHSIEFQRTGGLVDRLYRSSFGRNPQYAEFMPDAATIARNVRVGKDGWEETLTANEEAFIASWVDRAAFRGAFDSLTDDAYVSTLISNTSASFTQAEHDSLVSGLSAGTLSRADVLRQIVNNENFARARFNEAFVMMEYFGYLRRDPDAAGLGFWLNKLNQFEGNFERAEMVKAFINSGEYRARFSTR